MGCHVLIYHGLPRPNSIIKQFGGNPPGAAMSRQALPLFENLHRSIIPCLDSLTSPLSHARQAHAHFIKTSISGDSYLATKLIFLYANHNCFSDANLVFHSVPEQTLFSFSAVIQAFAKSNHFSLAFRMLSQMISQGIMPDGPVLPSVLKACSGLKLLKAGRQVHCFASVSGFESDLVLQSSLMHFYLRCDRIKDARKVFDGLPQPDVVACSALLSGYARHGLVEEAKELFSEIGNLGVEPNLFSWNGMITGFNHSGQYMEAVSIFRNMISEGFKPDDCSISSALSAVSDMENLGVGIQIHGHAIKQGLEHNNCILSALIDMYGKAGRVVEMSGVFDETINKDLVACNAFITGLSRNGHYHDALSIFKQIKCQGMELNVTSWTSMIAGCSQNGKDIQALELFREMQIEGVKPNSVTIPCLLPACGNIAALNHGKAAHCFSIRRGFSNDVCVGSALIDMYAKCGRIQLSRLCFQNMPTRNLVCWNAIMGGYAMHGKANEAMETFDMMQRSGQKPDFISFTCVLSACCQGGLTDKGEYYFDSMSRDHGIEPRVEHYACMVNLLSRAGRLDEAHAMIKQMPVEPDACVWGALLSSCKIHNNVNLGEVAAKKLFELEPSNPGNYVLLSNIYASKAMWAEVDTLRDTMKNMGLKKNPGCSWIELKNKVHMLLAGDKSHPQMMQIFEKLAELSMEMKKSGYLPHTDFVMQDVEEQDKEQILCGHSEKLAVVLGLLNTVPGTPLQVMKNIRICGDCHSVIKFISSFERREIFVRDTNRFHHFKEGVCSCGDYW